MAELLGVVATVAMGMLAYWQWRQSHIQQTRQRDAELFRWGSEVIALMAELESLCAPVAPSDNALSRHCAERIAVRSSALVDTGRLFFSNARQALAPASSELKAFSGLRPAMLDEVLRAHYVARWLALHGGVEGAELRQLVWTARGRFVSCLQEEMGASLKRTSDTKIGVEMDYDPTKWRVEHDREHVDPSGQIPIATEMYRPS